MSDLLIDSTVIIDYLRGRKEAVDFLDGIKAAGRPITHIVAVAEVISGARDRREQAAIEASLAPFQVLACDETDAVSSVDLLKKLRLSHGVGWPDCLIAATAVRLGLGVATSNVKHFTPVTQLRTVRPY